MLKSKKNTNKRNRNQLLPKKADASKIPVNQKKDLQMTVEKWVGQTEFIIIRLASFTLLIYEIIDFLITKINIIS